MIKGDSEDRCYVQPTEIALWKDYLDQGESNLEQRKKALLALALWSTSSFFNGFRAWGRLPTQYAKVLGVHQRFWGLYNLRPHSIKQLWLVWDYQEDHFAVVKEIAAGQEEQLSDNRLYWESEIYNDLLDMQDRRFRGLPPFIAYGQQWFASAFAPWGSLAWHFFASSLSVSNAELFKTLYPPSPFSGVPIAKSWRLIRAYFVQTARTLHNFHLQGLVHRNLHPDNLLLTHLGSNEIQEGWICDFDQSRNFHDIFIARHLDLVTHNTYTAPERWSKPSVQSSASKMAAYYGLPEGDVYSLAAILTDCLLEPHTDHTQRISALNHNRSLPLRLRQFLLQSLENDYHRRSTAAEFANRLEKITWRQGIGEWAIPLLSFLLLPVLGFIMYIIISEPMLNNRFCEGYVCMKGKLTPAELHWTKDNVYRLRGSVLVTEGTLIIEAGTKIVGDSAATLIIGKNAKIMANGLANDPIVFTSSQANPQAGDWGGVVILGKAPVLGKNYLEFCTYRQLKQEPDQCYFGGNDPHHSSGSMRYVRIEYGGDVIVENQEVNGLTLAGVGAGTTLEYITVYKSDDDCFEFFGGTVNARYLICNDPEDDAFDWEAGYRGKLQYLLFLAGHHTYRDFSEKGRYGLEGGDPDDQTKEQFGPEIWNVTLIGNPNLPSKTGGIASWSKDTRPEIHNLLARNFDLTEADRKKDIWKTWFLFSGVTNKEVSIFSKDEIKPKKEITSWECPPKSPFFTTGCFAGAFKDSTEQWNTEKWAGEISYKQEIPQKRQ
jgi:hypothetical protein